MLSFIAVKDKGKLKMEKQYLRLSMINEAERILVLRIYQKYDRSQKWRWEFEQVYKLKICYLLMVPVGL